MLVSRLSGITAKTITGRIGRCPGHPVPKGRLLDKLKSIAVPVTRRAPAKKPRRAGHPQVAPDHGVGGEIGPPRAAPRPLRSSVRHRYHVGQRLRVIGAGSYGSRLGGYCKVVALMPHEGGTFSYRVRSEAESFERVVAEADLALPDLP